MSLLGLLLILLVLALLFGGWGHGHSWGYWGWSPVGVIIVVLILLWLFGGLAHADVLAPVGVAIPLLMLGAVNPTPPNPTPVPVPPGQVDSQAGPPGLPYAVSWWLGVAMYVYLAFAAWVSAEYVGGHGADLPWGLGTPQNFAAVTAIAVVVGAVRGLLPNVQHTPQFRSRELLHARMGLLPRDLHRLEAGGEPKKLAGEK